MFSDLQRPAGMAGPAVEAAHGLSDTEVAEVGFLVGAPAPSAPRLIGGGARGFAEGCGDQRAGHPDQGVDRVGDGQAGGVGGPDDGVGADQAEAEDRVPLSPPRSMTKSRIRQTSIASRHDADSGGPRSWRDGASLPASSGLPARMVSR
jgi:hypothetical protein